MAHLRVGADVRRKLRHNLGQNFRVVSDLKTDDPAIVLGRVFHDIREIAIYGQEQAIQLMCFLNDRRIQRICCQMFAQASTSLPVAVKASMTEVATQWSAKSLNAIRLVFRAPPDHERNRGMRRFARSSDQDTL